MSNEYRWYTCADCHMVSSDKNAIDDHDCTAKYAQSDGLNPYAQRQRCSSGLHEEKDRYVVFEGFERSEDGSVDMRVGVAMRQCKHCRVFYA